MPDLSDIAVFLDTLLEKERYDEEDTQYRPSPRPVHRLGIALEAHPALGDWVQAERLDALFLHRPWKTDLSGLPPDLGILMSHLPFDEHLTLGLNSRLAPLLLLSSWEYFGEKEGRPLGMIGDCAGLSFEQQRLRLFEIFGGLEEIWPGTGDSLQRIVVVNAMTDALVRNVAAEGAGLYVTGQFRAPARPAVEETGMGVVTVGHRRSELWGLRALAGLLRERWSALTVYVLEN